MIVNDNSRVVNKLETSLTDDARVVTYDHHMFMIQATGSAKANGREPKSCFNQVFNFKLACFVVMQWSVWHTQRAMPRVERSAPVLFTANSN